jgi:hypothetical protein
MDEDLRRQRRNLMITACSMWVMTYSRMKAPANLKFNVYGTEITVERPEALFLVMWAFLGYFLYRFVVYVAEEYQREIHNRVVGELEGATTPLLKRIARKTYADHTGISTELHGLYLLKNPGAHKIKVIRPKGQHEELDVNVSRGQVRWALTKAAFKHLLLARTLTDYFFPALFALYVAWYAGTHEWAGTLRRLDLMV